jgi:hypothetical protein
MSQFGSFGALNSDSDRNPSGSSFLNTINSIPITISSTTSSSRAVKSRNTLSSLGMFDMEGVDDLDLEDKLSYQSSEEGDDPNAGSDDSEHDDSEDNVEEAEQAEEADPDTLHFGRYRESTGDEDFCVGSLRVGSLAKHSYLDCIENEENQEKISNLPIKMTGSSQLSKARRSKANASEAQLRQYAQSLPISIPNWKPMNNHQAIEDADLDWVREIGFCGCLRIFRF